MRWLALLGFLVVFLPVGASAQSTTCSSFTIGGITNTNCYTQPPLIVPPAGSGPPPGYMDNPSFLRKFTCKNNQLTNPSLKCGDWVPSDFEYVPIPKPAAPPPPAQPPPSPAPTPCAFQLGFKALHDAIPGVVGGCTESEGHNPANGDALQHTTGGLLVWRKADNFTAFTDGYRTWVSGPNGVQQRLNTECFAWEAGCTRG